MICVECGQPVNDLHHQFRGSGILLTRCEYCNCVADKYVEHEGVIIFLDLILHKPQVAMQACVCVRARVRAYLCDAGVCVCVCVCERARARARGGVLDSGGGVFV